MKYFECLTKIDGFDTAEEFISSITFKETDFIVLTKSIYHQYFKGRTGNAKIVFKSDYGQGEPTVTMMNAMIRDFIKGNYSRVFAIGGGAVIDMAKVLVVTQGEDAEVLFKKEVAFEKRCELVAIPTTCGAGSEVSSISILEIESMNSKFGLADSKIRPDYAILIPQLLENLPYHVFITSTIDGMIHAIESFLSAKSTIYTELFGCKAIELYIEIMNRLAIDNKIIRKENLKKCLLASNFAGIAFSNTGTGAVHALSYPLSGIYHVPHGEANALFLTNVLKLYDEKNKLGKISLLRTLLSNKLGCNQEETFSKLGELLNGLIPLNPLREYGMKDKDINEFADNVIKNQQRLLSNSYCELNEKDIIELYTKLF